MNRRDVMTVLNTQTKILETFNIHTGELVASSTQVSQQWVYSLEIADAIINLVRQGKTYTSICTMEGFPPLHIFYQWRSIHPDFSKRLQDARADRANYFHDKAVDVLDSAEGITKDEVPGAKLRFDGYMKLAEKGSPSEFGNKIEHVGDGIAPKMIILNTGINRGDSHEQENIDGGRDIQTIPTRVIEREVAKIGADISGLGDTSGAEADKESGEEEVKEESR